MITSISSLSSATSCLKADFHSAENIARSTFSAHFLLNCSNQIQISEHISKESEREKSIARHFPLNGNPPLKADFHSAENIARSTFSAHFLLNCSNQIQISEHISKESEREKSIARHFPLNGNPPLYSLLAATSQFSVLICQKMQLTGWDNGN